MVGVGGGAGGGVGSGVGGSAGGGAGSADDPDSWDAVFMQVSIFFFFTSFIYPVSALNILNNCKIYAFLSSWMHLISSQMWKDPSSEEGPSGDCCRNISTWTLIVSQ